MSRRILINSGPYETRAALLEDGKVVEVFHEIPDSEKIVGCIFKGRVSNILPGTQSAFVDIGLQKDAYLTLSGVDTGEGDDDLQDVFRAPIEQQLKVGQEVILQILKEPTGVKGPRSTMTLSFPGRYLVLMPMVDHIGISRRIGPDSERERIRAIAKRICPKGMGIIFRTAAEGLEERELAADLKLLLRLWEQVEKKIKTAPPRTLLHRDIPLPLKIVREYFTDDVDQCLIDSEEAYRNILEMCDFLSPLQRAGLELYKGPAPLFDAYGIDREIDNALQPKIVLESGASLVIERTEALSTIDVNSGRFAGGVDLEETVFKVNLETAKEIARQIRLRNLAGMIVIDFIDMNDAKHRAKVLKAFRDAMKNDRNRPHILDFSELGLVQMTRRRTSHSLEEILKSPCPCCQGRRMTLSLITLVNRIRNRILDEASRYETPAITVRAHQQVVEALRGPGEARLKELEKRCGRTITLQPQYGLDIESYTIDTGAGRIVGETRPTPPPARSDNRPKEPMSGPRSPGTAPAGQAPDRKPQKRRRGGRGGRGTSRTKEG
ncbi:MAG TPA: Rne/Rng family ribonuclease [Candidatus Ozemobacteraceae bacterium]|nr:Rne/Rng family ribonuclease [Candidatus Ozemobacteraceae bacterium]